MKNLFSLLFSLILFGVNNSIGQEISFTEIRNASDLTTALKKAHRADKPIYIDIYATWCGPCKMMDQQTFSDKKVAAYYNQQFTNLKMDGELIIGEAFMEHYGLDSYPTGLFLSVEELPEDFALFDGEYWPKVIMKQVGFEEPLEFLETGKSSFFIKQKLSGWEGELTRDGMSLESAYEYVSYLSSSNEREKASEIALHYLKEHDFDGMYPYYAWEMIKDFVADPRDEFTRDLFREYDDLVLYRGEEEIALFLGEFLQESMLEAAMSEDEELFELSLELVIPLFMNSLTEQEAMELDLISRQAFYTLYNDYARYIEVTDAFLLKYATNDGDLYFEEAKKILTEEEEGLYQAAERWAQTSIDIDNDAMNNLLYSLMLIKNDKPEKAREVLEALSTRRNLTEEERGYVTQMLRELD